MTCGTHTTASVTAAAFGFNPSLSGSFLKRRDSCECTTCSLFRKENHPCRVQRAAPETDTFSPSLSPRFFVLLLLWCLHYLVSWPSQLDAQVLVSLLCFTLETMEACCLKFRHLSDITHPLHLPNARLLPICTASSACVYQCACVRV